MSENLVIVESPGKVRKIGGFLGKDFEVKASYGHVRDLPEKKLGVDIESAFKPEYTVSSDKKKRIEELKAAAAKATTVWLASDEDREGEAIAWHLVETLGIPAEKVRRIGFNEITREAVLNAIENPREINMNLVMAQQARRVLDRLVGYELSPVLWKKIRSGLSAGRVQSAVLRLVVDREREIEAFESRRFYRIEGTFEACGRKITALLEGKFETPEEALAFLESCKGTGFVLSGIDRKGGVRTPASPFTTSLLQQEAGRKLGMSVTQTMATAQKLYEAGLITYMRTDSVNLSALAINTAKESVISLYGAAYSKPRNYKTRTKGAQEAHEAIRPTDLSCQEISASALEKKLYSLIWKRTIASQMADARTEKLTLTVKGDNGAVFTAQSEKILFDGFLKVYREDRDDEESTEFDSTLPDFTEGTPMKAAQIVSTESYTARPMRYSEASLVKKMEELEIGRPSTYASTLKTLFDKEYVIKGDKAPETRKIEILTLRGGEIARCVKSESFGGEKKKIFPENIGITVTDYLEKSFRDIVDYDFTAKVEEDFDKIAEGSKVWNVMIGEFYKAFHSSVETAIVTKMNKDVRELGTDPASGRMVTARLARYGAIVQLGAADDPDKRIASLEKGMLIGNVTLEDALRLLSLPRTAGTYNGGEVVVAIGPRGPYVRYAGEDGKARYVSIPRDISPYDISPAQCLELVVSDGKRANAAPIAEFKDAGIQILNGMYGPYIKCDRGNFRIPKGIDPATVDAARAEEIVAKGLLKKSSKK